MIGSVMDVFESAPASKRLRWCLNLADLPRCDSVWHFVKRWSQNLFDANITAHPQIWCSKIMRLWIRCFGNNPEYSGGKRSKTESEQMKYSEFVKRWFHDSTGKLRRKVRRHARQFLCAANLTHVTPWTNWCDVSHSKVLTLSMLFGSRWNFRLFLGK